MPHVPGLRLVERNFYVRLQVQELPGVGRFLVDVESLVTNFGKIELYLVPKSNATVEGPWDWKRMLFRFVTDTKKYLEDYYRRNQSESCFAEDKKRVGWRLGQKRPDRIDTANMLTCLWHNLYWLVV